MTQARHLHRQQSLIDFNPYDQRFQHHQSDPNTLSEIPQSAHHIGCMMQAQPMAQPHLQQYSPEAHLYGQQWQLQRQQTLPQDIKPVAGERPDYHSNHTGHAHAGLWGGAMFNRNYNLQGGLCMSYGTMAGNEGAAAVNGTLMYPETPSQGTTDNTGLQYGDTSTWDYQRSNELSSSMRATGSSLESISSLSPKTYTTDTVASDIPPFTPDTSNDGASSCRSWARFNTSSFPTIKTSSPKYPTGMDSMTARYSSRPLPINRGAAGSSSATEADVPFNGLPSPYDGASQFDSVSYFPKSCPSESPSYSARMTYSQAVGPYKPHESQGVGYLYKSDPTTYSPSDNRPQRANGWGETNTSVSARAQFQVPRVMDTQVQRKADDEILLEGKRNGLTYKEIRKKMAVKCAESTLRGRYRSLTKARKDRVRKPTWTANDIRLMNQYVQAELDRIDAHQHVALGYEQRLAKVPWKKITDKIHANGGTYHFGNATCKRKYIQLHPAP
ncbi:hypothetical protein FB567DRAFT_631722 [Paraphoma chrysanthemicola]|uniref:Myb-like domain-containing protein n=1 Tax=Paraphoma chrysanthemicola TaxID=798071 RepID=A0A8K0VVK0_9PLEO|nr:hypothetical protein FB567DRAFT_631722 [Paraphoma chrysanthemicola]